MSDIFISYSRSDLAFVEWLRDQLTAAQRTVWVDQTDIPPSAAWRSEIEQGITSADAVICVISPEYIASPSCAQEVAFAQTNNKRLVPIVRRDVHPQDVGQPLNSINWIYFRASDPVDRSMQLLFAALDTDLAYVKYGTRLLVRAKEWSAKGQNPSFTLRGNDLAEAEAWIASSGGKIPPPSQEQTQYLFASRKVNTARQRTTISALTVGIVLTLVLSILSSLFYYQRNVQLIKVNAQNKSLQAQALAGRANDALVNQHFDQALLLAQTASLQEDDIDTRNTLFDSLEKTNNLATVLVSNTAPTTVLNANYGAAAYSADGATLMTADLHNFQVQIWDAAARTVRRRIAVPVVLAKLNTDGTQTFDSFDGAAYSPDGRFVATCTNFSDTILWDAATGTQIQTFPQDQFNAVPLIGKASVLFSPNNRYLAWTIDANDSPRNGTVMVWDLLTNQLAYDLPLEATGNSGISATLAFSSDSSQLAVGEQIIDGTTNLYTNSDLEVFSMATGLRTANLQLSLAGSPYTQGSVGTLAFLPDSSTIALGGETTTGGGIGQMLFWDVIKHRFVGQPLQDTAGRIYAFGFSPDGNYFVSGYGDGGIRIWDAKHDAPLTKLLPGDSNSINQIVMSPNSQQFVTTSEDGQVLLWRLNPFSALSHFDEEGVNSLSQVQFSPDGKWMATGNTGSIALWNVATGGLVKTLVAPNHNDITSLAFSPDSKTLASGDDQVQILLWNVATGQTIGDPLLGHKVVLPGSAVNFISELKFSPDGKYLASCGFDDQVILWNVGTHAMVNTFTDSTELVFLRQTAFSPDGQWLAVTGPTQDVILWDMQRNTQGNTLSTGKDIPVRALAFYPHQANTLAALRDDGEVVTYNVQNNQQIGKAFADGSSVQDTINTPHLTFNATGSLLVESHDYSVTLWSIAAPGSAQKYLHTITLENSAWNSTLSPDGKYLATATDGGGVEVRYATLNDWRQQACVVANRDLTKTERAQFGVTLAAPMIC